MDHFDEIKDIWKSHKTERLPSIASINDAIKNFHSTNKRNIFFFVFLSVTCIVTMIWVIIDYQSNLWTTRVGESLFILIGLYLFFSKLKLLRRNKQEELLSTNDYLDNLKKKSQKGALSETRAILFILLSLAFFFYVYELLSVSNTRLIFGYCLLFLFLVFMWFVYRPLMVKRQQNKIQILLTKIDNIKNQTDEKG